MTVQLQTELHTLNLETLEQTERQNIIINELKEREIEFDIVRFVYFRGREALLHNAENNARETILLEERISQSNITFHEDKEKHFQGTATFQGTPTSILTLEVAVSELGLSVLGLEASVVRLRASVEELQASTSEIRTAQISIRTEQISLEARINRLQKERIFDKIISAINDISSKYSLEDNCVGLEKLRLLGSGECYFTTRDWDDPNIIKYRIIKFIEKLKDPSVHLLMKEKLTKRVFDCPNSGEKILKFMQNVCEDKLKEIVEYPMSEERKEAIKGFIDDWWE